MESALRIVAPNFSASASASADLPLAVGPAMRSAHLTGFVLASGAGILMPSSAVVATLIADPATMRLSDARIARAAQGVAGFGGWRWLDEGVAADLVFDGQAAAIRLILEEALAGEPID